MYRLLLLPLFALALLSCEKENIQPSTSVEVVDVNQPTLLAISVVSIQQNSHANACEPYTEHPVENASVRVYAGTSATGAALAVLKTDRSGQAMYTEAEKNSTHFVSTTFADGTVVERMVSTPAHRTSNVQLSH